MILEDAAAEIQQLWHFLIPLEPSQSRKHAAKKSKTKNEQEQQRISIEPS